jgi:hypothetical protein
MDLYTLYFVLNGLHNGEDGVFAKTAGGDGVQQKDGWYWLLDGMDDGQGPFESKEKAKINVEADETYKELKHDREMSVKLMDSGGFHCKPTSWKEVGYPVLPVFLRRLTTYSASELGIDVCVGVMLKVVPQKSIFLVKRDHGLYLVNTGGHNYVRNIRYVGWEATKAVETGG